MNISNGVDIIKISRIEKSLSNQRFLKRVYTDKEIKLYNDKGKPAQFLAANFAAKEAFSKALGTGIRGFWFSDVEILRNELGAPYFNFYGAAKEIVKNKQLSFSLSISHEKEYAIAFVIAYKQ